ncbi:hypothetical protein B0A48_15070 [Cryoendolithus antarcticus]|uniref:histidine kinase n=1 Tax=Cryoendolithus antarcticus TaxID=1507870 RepID=A0A1V8SK30_9PEZI|nr:hypothetical protein B0A48_15070 [Cryoendolithus antarcticus]
MSSPTSQQDSSEEESDLEEPNTAQRSTRPTVQEATTGTSRPHLVRAPARLSNISPGEHDESEEERYEDAVTAQGSAAVSNANVASAGRGGTAMANPDEEALAKIPAAVNAKILFQQPSRTSHGKKQPSPIMEEESNSPKPGAAALVSGLPSASTLSTESTGSGRTVRASAPATPADTGLPMRTPSYPFPYVPGTPRGWPGAFHQPFTALSPTVMGLSSGMQETPGKQSTGTFSGHTTPAANTEVFLPPNMGSLAPADPRFPSPNLYELVLQLNAEPGFETWWSAVTHIMHQDFKAERVTLSMPADPTDFENVPWGQKATFSMNGPEEFVQCSAEPSYAAQSLRPTFAFREPSTEGVDDLKPQKLHPERLRPRLEARHSYAGHPRDAKEQLAEPPSRQNVRPTGPQRTVTHASGLPTAVGPSRFPTRRFPSSYSVRHNSLTDPEFSSVAGAHDAGPFIDVFPVLKALDHEAYPLLESAGVIRMLERGRVVTVTRDYVSDKSSSDDSSQQATTATSDVSTEQSPHTSRRSSRLGQAFGNYRQVFASDNVPEQRRGYEEYEQYPSSPWAQSPAPSPAVQTDEDENPFFASQEQQVEDSFNPTTTTPRDYSQFAQVEAIGIDKASTVIHIPLIHPMLSQPLRSLRLSSERRQRRDEDPDRKAPIAILSILTTHVPYPLNLTQSLTLLGPHLATSLSVAQQFATAPSQNMVLRHRRSISGHQVSSLPMSIDPSGISKVLNRDLDDPRMEVEGSMTSPSDYSGRSRYSPSSSIVGTPGWDPASHGWSTSRSVTGTPAHTGSEVVDDYFDSKKKVSTQGSGSVQSTPAKQQGRRRQSQEPKPQSGDDLARSDKHLRTSQVKDGKSPKRPSDRDRSATNSIELQLPSKKSAGRQALPQVPEDTEKQHKYLHSYGADFQSSFGSLSALATGDTQASTMGGSTNTTSSADAMPPPSERLLRTIIDSLPVQVFTAEQESGKLTWVNSKFLIYRGQDSRQVLSEPWQAIHPDDRQVYMDTWKQSLRTGQQLQQKLRLQRFDGSYRWFYVRAAPLKDKRQNIVHWIGTNMDFHEQHIAEANLAKQQETIASEAKYRTLANSSPQIVFAVNRAKGVTFCNSQWMYYSGQKEAQALGVGFMDYVHPEDLAKCRLPTFDDGTGQPTNVPTSMPPEPRRTTSMSVQSSSGSSDTEKAAGGNSSPAQAMPQRKLSELATTGILKVSRDADGRPSYATEVRLKSKDGGYRWHLVRILLAEPLAQAGSDDETWYGTCTDINDHKTLERDLKETMDEKSHFLSNMSHEIRTPLNGITGMVNFLIDSNLTAEQMEHVNIIRASTEGLRGLINDILDLSKAEAGMIQLNIDWMHVRALIEEVNDLTSTMAIDKGLELNYVVEEDVPMQVKADRFRLRQILLNVIGNAIKFTQEGEVFVRCSVQEDQHGELTKGEMFIKFEVVDTGRGFNDREAEALFKRFSQIDGSSTRQHGGTGLGLVISRQLAQLHGGDMSARGSPGKGSTFAFFVKTSLPTDTDQPPTPVGSMSGTSIPILPLPMHLLATPGATPSPLSEGPMRPLSKLQSAPGVLEQLPKPSPKFLTEHTGSPAPYSPDLARMSPAASSASSGLSMRSAVRTSSLQSERSSASSYVPDPALQGGSTMKLTLPGSDGDLSRIVSSSASSDATPRALSALHPGGNTPSGAVSPPMYSVLVLSPLKYSREATIQHVDKTLPSNVPHQITAHESLLDFQRMIGGHDPVIFSHVVAVLQDVSEIVALLDQVLNTPAYASTMIVIITDLAQKKRIMDIAPQHDFNTLESDRRLLFIFKPLKPSRFAAIFDPDKGREMSTDRNQDSAQQVALSQKQVFEELTKRLGNRGKRVLLVEDNEVNQMVILKFFSKVAIEVDTVMDGVQGTDKIFSQNPGYYHTMLCDLHMPNKDGYQTCREIRRWEKKNRYQHMPIIALSANVLGDVYQKCVEAGFNSYLTKPVDFKELSKVLVTFMDPDDPRRAPEFMRRKR